MTLPAARLGLALCLACAAAAAACRASSVAAPGRPPRGRQPSSRTSLQQARLDFLHTNGASPDKHIVETMGSGGLFLDYDNDGWLDVFLVDGGSLADPTVAGRARHRLFRNRGDGTFEDVTAASGLVASGLRHGRLRRRLRQRRLDRPLRHQRRRRTRCTGTPAWHVHRRRHGRPASARLAMSTSCAFVDVDRDGDLDLFVANYVDLSAGNSLLRRHTGSAPTATRSSTRAPNVLYRNNGNGTFTDVSREAGLLRPPGNGLGVVFADYDDDGWPDLFVANDPVPNFLYHNEGRGAFSEIGLLAGVAVASDGKARAGMGTDFGDYDGDGRLDLVVTNHELETHNLFRNLGGGLFADATAETGVSAATLPFVGFGAVFLDYDNDGDLDLAIANGHVLDNAAALPRRRQLRAAQPAAAQRRRPAAETSAARRARASRPRRSAGRWPPATSTTTATWTCWSPTTASAPTCCATTAGIGSDALLVRAGRETEQPQRHRRAIRARGRRQDAGPRGQVRLELPGAERPAAHFGLGRATQADRLEIRWPQRAHRGAAEHRRRRGRDHRRGRGNHRANALHRAVTARSSHYIRAPSRAPFQIFDRHKSQVLGGLVSLFFGPWSKGPQVHRRRLRTKNQGPRTTD